MQKNIIIAVVVSVLAGSAAGFFGGMKYQQSKARTGNFQGFAGRNTAGRNAVNGGSFRPVSGEIISLDDKSITVKLADGSSKIVLFGGSVTISKSSEASRSDLAVGTKVAVFGNTNSDGSVTAQNIQINPAARPSPMPSQ